MTHNDDFERDLRVLFETAAPSETSRAGRRLSHRIERQDIVRRALQVLAYAACAGAVAWWAFPVLAGFLGFVGTPVVFLATIAGAILWGALKNS